MIPPGLHREFLLAGWHPLRRRPVDDSIAADHPAFEILSSLSGLRIGRCDAGIECATSDLRFVRLDRDDPIIEIWESLLDTKLIGVAEVHHGHGELYVDRKGRCFGSSRIHDAFYLEGLSFGVAADNLLRGRRSRPMLRPDQALVTLYGDDFGPDHPMIYHY